MCLGSSRYFSMKILSLPNAFSDSLLAFLYSFTMSASSRTTLIPRPPPRSAAFSITGYPAALANSTASSSDSIAASFPGTVGTFTELATSLDCILSPRLFIIFAVGPMNSIPSSSHACANTGFSARNPYPGWMASTPFAFASAMISEILRYASTGALPLPI